MFNELFSLLTTAPALHVFASASASASVAAAANVQPAAQWPNGPFTTSGPWIVDARGDNFSYAGVNWPGAAETMVPEGLQYQSVEAIVARVRSLGMNSIRLTYATEMVDQVYDNNMTDVPILDAFVGALGQDNGTDIFDRVIANNPSFDRSTTRLQVFDTIAEECALQNIYVHLDNHISKASWCCSPFDGNAWWGDTDFSPTNWTRGLSYMATHGKQWPNLISMSLYNELRPPLGAPIEGLRDNYTWAVWYEQVQRGTKAIHDANADVLVFLSGLDGDTDLQPVVEGAALAPGNATFRADDFPAGSRDKLVLELHSYDILAPVVDCATYDADLLESGFSAVAPAPAPGGGGDVAANRLPVVLSEWGFANDDATWRNRTYAVCVQRFLRDVVPGAGWMVWALGGSYYVRQGKQDYDETWGLLNHDWSDWRSPAYIEGGLKPLVAATLSATNGANESTTNQNSSTSQGGGDGGSTSPGVKWGGSVMNFVYMLAWSAVVCFLSTV